MRILHYTLGFDRKGGLNKYANDVIRQQSTSGHTVTMLYPSGFSLWPFGTIVKKEKSFENVSVFKIQNSPLVSLSYGIKDPSYILDNKRIPDFQQMVEFYENIKPQIFHIHTLMGLPFEFVKFMKNKNVKIIFTTHDYYGLCPRINFVDWIGRSCDSHDYIKCTICNYNAPQKFYLNIRNSWLAHKFKKTISKNILVLGKMGNGHRKTDKKIPKIRPNFKYEIMFKYFKEFYFLFDLILFNSTVTMEKFLNYIEVDNFSLCSISHSDILDKRALKKFNPKHIRLTFIGSLDPFKGFSLLKKSLQNIHKEKIENWILNVWRNDFVGVDKDINKIFFKGRYNIKDLDMVFGETDLLIVPSICKETFGFVVLEALSRGVPVLVSENVGAKDIVKNYDGWFIYKDEHELESKIKTILTDSRKLQKYNESIVANEWRHSLDEHIATINRIYIELIDAYCE